MTAPAVAYPDPTIAALDALRELIRASLQLPRNRVGGWEIEPTSRVTVSVYSHKGRVMQKPGGGRTARSDTLSVEVTARGGTVLSEAEVFPIRDALATLIDTFTHPAIAGAQVTDWGFEIRGTGTFDNVLTVTAEVLYRSAPPHLPGAPDPNLGLAVQALLVYVRQENDDG